MKSKDLSIAVLQNEFNAVVKAADVEKKKRVDLEKKKGTSAEFESCP